ncbi:molybdopterin-dependent oxidoreductase [Leifsonia sp. YAF41]|uniref:molybdopterin-dependent oxidoreductase n=1 Tax=Leifsonia sp. YAF41 TaxID=3233086 RepID=UPI003F9BC952
MSSTRVHVNKWRWLAAACGLLSAVVTLALAEFASLFVAPASSPLFAVGGWIVDLSPPGFKTWIISLFGTSDKLVLFICLGVFLVVLALFTGVAEFERPPVGTIALVAVAAIAALAVVTRPSASIVWALPTALGAAVGIWVLRQSIARLRRWRGSQGEGERASAAAGVDRRSFLTFAGLGAVAALIVGVGSQLSNAANSAVSGVREALRLPKPAVAAPPVPAGAELDVPGLATYVTPNGQFYRIDTALQVPAVNPDDWQLRVVGMVDREVTLSFADLLALPLAEHMVTLACVSNEVGGDLIGNAAWLGYPIREILKRAGPTGGADMVLSRSADGWTAGSPLDVLLDPGTDALLAVGMNGKPLPLEHGFPVRKVVPGLYGYVSATKWVVELKVTRFADETGYWTDKGWSARGPIKTQSRIDTPRSGAALSAGRTAVAGVAWAQHTGIDRVEVRVDGGSWQPARLADSVSADTWRQWVLDWDASAGDHTIEVRATDASGYTQTSAEAPPAPDGATGWHRISVSVT